MKTVRAKIIAPLAFAALLLVAGCGGNENLPFTAETDEAGYREAQQYTRQGLTSQALSAYLKVIAKRGDVAAESHLDAGVIYLNHIKDPLTAIYHFRKYLEQQPNSKQAQFVRKLIDTAKRDFARTLPAQPLESQSAQFEIQEQLDRLQRENDQLKAQLAAFKGGPPTPFLRSSKAAVDKEETSTIHVPLPTAAEETAAVENESPISVAPVLPEPAVVEPVNSFLRIPTKQAVATKPAAAPITSPTRPALTTTATPTRQPPTKPTAPSGRKHTVGRGDTLYSLAQKYYGVRTGAKVQEIFNANRGVLRSPTDPLKLGQELKIP